MRMFPSEALDSIIRVLESAQRSNLAELNELKDLVANGLQADHDLGDLSLCRSLDRLYPLVIATLKAWKEV